MWKRLLGQAAETEAESYLVARGLRTVARNWRCRFGEIDLIMKEGDTLVFVEVRLRNHARFGDGATSVTPAKQTRLVATARAYLASLNAMPPCRFDVVSLREGEAPVWLRNVIIDMG